jgi:hypothetical protein
MKIFLTLITLTLLSFSLSAEEIKCEQSIFLNDKSQEFVQRGCCSHHGGVCGCSGGRQACCDGTLSPSCLCHSDDLLKVLKEEMESEVNRPNT